MANAPSPLTDPLPWNLVSTDYAAEIVPQFERYSAAALELAGPIAGKRVLDVACGPGTLTVVAAKTAKHVHALDFSEGMIKALEARVREAGLTNITATVGDGQALPYEADAFDVTASMFGLMFFPDRAKGLAEMKRVLVPGGRAVISSWRPFTEAPLMHAALMAITEQMPDLPFGKTKPNLGEVAEMIEELEAAGFSDVRAEIVTHHWPVTDIEDFWRGLERTMAPLVLLKKKMGDAWPPLGAKILASLKERFGDGPQECPMPSIIGVGVA